MNLGLPGRKPCVQGVHINRMDKKIIIIFFLIILALFLRSPSFEQPINRDISTYATIGLQMQHGALPYKDLFDHKQPLIYLVYFLIGLIAPQSNSAIQITAALISSLAGIIIFLYLSNQIGLIKAFCASTIFTILSTSQVFEGTDLNTEHLLIPIICAAYFYPIIFSEKNTNNWIPFIAGILGGFAILSKAVAVFALPGAFLFLLIKRKRYFSTSFIYALGVLTPCFALILIYLYSAGVKDLYYQNIIYNKLYMITAPMKSWLTYVSLPSYYGILFALALGVGLVKLELNRGRDPIIWAIVLWLIGTTIGAKLGGRDFPHYFAPMVAPIIVLTVQPFILQKNKISQIIPLLLLTFLSIPLFAGTFQTFYLTPQQIGVQMYGQQSEVWEQQQVVGTWLKNHANPNDYLYVAGNEPGFYWTSGLRPATKFIYNSPLDSDHSLQNQFIKDLKENQPKWVIGFSGQALTDAIPMESLKEEAIFGTVHIYSYNP